MSFFFKLDLKERVSTSSDDEGEAMVPTLPIFLKLHPPLPSQRMFYKWTSPIPFWYFSRRKLHTFLSLCKNSNPFLPHHTLNYLFLKYFSFINKSTIPLSQENLIKWKKAPYAQHPLYSFPYKQSTILLNKSFSPAKALSLGNPTKGN